MSKNIKALILSGGLGTRMKSDMPKVLHKILGYSLVEHVILNLKEASIDDIGLVVGYKHDIVKETLGEKNYKYYLQEKQLGTGHAVIIAKEFFANYDGKVIVLCGDAPLLNKEILEDFIQFSEEENLDCAVLTAVLDNPASYGRIVRNKQGIEKIVEYKDATEIERQIKEVNSGTYIFDAKKLYAHLDDLKNNNAQNEYYLTDMIEIFIKNKYNVNAFISKNSNVLHAVNDKSQLAECLSIMQKNINKTHMLNGVTIIDPMSTYIDRNVNIEPEVTIYPNTIIQNNSSIGKNTVIYSSRINNSNIGKNCTIDTSTITDSTVSNNVSIGPYAHLRPNSNISDNVRLGNFVEVKNSKIGKNTKVSHLTYIGDGEIGEDTNVGCGVVFVNYDGKKKHLTKIGNKCFIGCNVNLIAPVEVGDNTYIAAGSTITDSVGENSLAIARSRQTIKENWNK